MLPIEVRALVFATLSWLSYLTFKASDAMRGWITDGRAEDCFAIVSVVALGFTLATRHRLTVKRVAQAWGACLVVGLVLAAVQRWPPPMMMFLDVGFSLMAAVTCVAHRWALRNR